MEGEARGEIRRNGRVARELPLGRADGAERVRIGGPSRDGPPDVGIRVLGEPAGDRAAGVTRQRRPNAGPRIGSQARLLLFR